MGKSLKDFGFEHRPKLSESNKSCYDGEDFSHASINGCKQNDSTFRNTNFQYAAITGSIFTNCKFDNTKFDNADLEFCNFSKCELKNEKIFGVSFNNSDFIGTTFFDVSFSSVTMTGCLLNECELDKVQIESSTFENACFKKCKLKNMDLRNLNMEFMEFIEPEMENVTLPSSQVPYMFGCFEYLLKNPPNVFLSVKDNEKITVTEYLNEFIPLLKEHYLNENEFFPLANIFMAEAVVLGKEDSYAKAMSSIYDGIMQNNTYQDYRLLKFYIKLIADCKKISNKDRHNLYKNICSLNNDNESQSPIARNYRKHIADIKSYLFSEGHRISSIKFVSNIEIHSKKLGLLLRKLYEIAKFDYTGPVEIILSQNSPLCIEIKFFGDENIIESNIEELIKLDTNKIKDKNLLEYNNDNAFNIAYKLYKQKIFLYLWEVSIGNKLHTYYNKTYEFYNNSLDLIGG